ncbi:MAG: ElyC/SanA/YdcF family protein [Bdellovibrionota bacterium]|nr:ElyC/SanA/YdcF family protein [Bdellovibrionota bacterium]
MKKKIIKLNFSIFFVFFIFTALFLFRNDLLQLPAKLIEKRSALSEKGQVGIILMGGFYDRSVQMAKLYKKKWVKKIIYAEAEIGKAEALGIGLSQGQMVDKMLDHLEVPKEDRIFIQKTRNTSTFDEAKVLLLAIKERFPNAKKVILVTSWYHSSRAEWIFKKVNSFGIEIISVPNEMPKNWWEKEAAFLSVFNEYLKWVYYLLNY